jgi:hypothetical protein
VAKDNFKLTKEFIEEEYVKKGRLLKDIAKSIGCSYSYLNTRRIKFNILRKLNYQNLAGQKFNKLTAINIDLKKSTASTGFWNCKCECGREKLASAKGLKNGTIKSCGCEWRTAYKGISGQMFWSIKRHAEKRGLEVNITIFDLWDLFVKQKERCALSGVPLELKSGYKDICTASLDRIDSLKGYVLDNIQWVHKKINVMKMDMNETTFKDWARKINNFNDSSTKTESKLKFIDWCQ